LRPAWCEIRSKDDLSVTGGKGKLRLFLNRLLIHKNKKKFVPEIDEKIKAIHSYTVPEIIGFGRFSQNKIISTGLSII